MISLISQADAQEIQSLLLSSGIKTVCEQSDEDVFVHHSEDIYPVLLQEGKKAWDEGFPVRFDQAFIVHSESQTHPVRVVNGYYQARNYRIRQSLGPAC